MELTTQFIERIENLEHLEKSVLLDFLYSFHRLKVFSTLLITGKILEFTGQNFSFEDIQGWQTW